MGPHLVALVWFLALLPPNELRKATFENFSTEVPEPIALSVPVSVWSSDGLIVLLTNTSDARVVVNPPSLVFDVGDVEATSFTVFQPVTVKPLSSCCPKQFQKYPVVRFLQPFQQQWYRLHAVTPEGAQRFRLVTGTTEFDGPVNAKNWFSGVPFSGDNICKSGRITAEWLGPKAQNWAKVPGTGCNQLKQKAGIYRITQKERTYLWTKNI
jgi:hypothetical protein